MVVDLKAPKPLVSAYVISPVTTHHDSLGMDKGVWFLLKALS